MVEYGIALSRTSGGSGGSSGGLDLPAWGGFFSNSSLALMIAGGVCALLFVLFIVR